jgi:hypothetical protein
MPIGSSKLGVLGAGLVPGGTETFNASGTFSVPPGVKKVSITGAGGTGILGILAMRGNSGNAGGGGAGRARRYGVEIPAQPLDLRCCAVIAANAGGGGVQEVVAASCAT